MLAAEAHLRVAESAGLCCTPCTGTRVTGPLVDAS